MSKIEYCYSTNQEDYEGRYASREDALEAAREYLWGDDEDVATAWTARLVPLETLLPDACEGMAERLVEGLEESLYEECGGDDCIIDIHPEKLAILDKMLASFFAEHAIFNRWAVADVVEHEVVVDEVER